MKWFDTFLFNKFSYKLAINLRSFFHSNFLGFTSNLFPFKGKIYKLDSISYEKYRMNISTCH